MKIHAMVVSELGGPDVLALREVDLAWPRGPHDVLVRLHAASINPADLYFRTLGGYLAGPEPFVLGHDGMGVVAGIGEEVTTVALGDRVSFCNGGIGGAMGTYAEAAVIPDWQLAKVPDAVDDLTAAALPLVAITGWESLYDRAQVQPGETVLIHGGAGGTGHIAVQLAALHGAHVAATVSTPEKAALARAWGAEHTIPYRDTDYVQAALDWSGGLDVMFDNVGGDTLPRGYRAMAPYGRVVTLMGLTPDDGEQTAYNRNLSLHAVMMLTPMWLGLADRLRAQTRIVTEALALVAERRLKIHHAASYPLAQAATAHAWIETGAATGKVTLTMR